MIVYHYSQTLREPDVPEPGHQNLTALCEPFIQALEYSRDCFYGMLLSGKYLYAVMDRSNMREWSDYAKWATEGIFEYIRKKEFPQCISRLHCIYFCAGLSDCIRAFQEDWGEETEEERAKVHLFEAEVPDSCLEMRDIALFDAAYDAIADRQDLDTAAGCARRYYAGEHGAEPKWECLSTARALAVRDISSLLPGRN